MLKFFFFIFLIVLPFNTHARHTVESFAYSDEWLALGHYQKKLGRMKGTIASDKFYLSDQGRHNPLAELKESIKLFQTGEDRLKCLFPGRYLLLKRHNFVVNEFPKCQEYEQFKTDLQPSGVTLLFTDAYMNNASSLFGHTLLRIDTLREKTQLLAHGINYGAYTAGYENSFLYAIYGLTGMYQGGFTTKPYYDIINTYNNLENRDIWEYVLNFTPAEIDFLVAHIWELGQISTPYYFFTQNCSYMLLEVLDAVRPSLQLGKQFPLQVIPLDTVKAINAIPGFVKETKYRPSRQGQINHRVDQMKPSQLKAFENVVKVINRKKERTESGNGREANISTSSVPTKNLAQGIKKPLPQNEIVSFDVDTIIQQQDINLAEEEKADVYETAYQYVQYQYVAKKIDLRTYRQMSFKLLQARNKVRFGQKFNELSVGINPVISHDSTQISFGVGARNGNVFQQLGFRPAYHSLMDNPSGYLYGAEINFLELIWRHYDQKDRYVLEKFDILKIASFSPINTLYKPLSYSIDFNVSRQINPSSLKEGYTANVALAGGGTFEISRHLWFYALTSLDGAYGGFLPNNHWLGLGFSSGILGKLDKVSFKAEAKKVFASSKIGSTLLWRAEASYHFSTNTSLAAELTHIQNYGRDENQSLVMIKQHF